MVAAEVRLPSQEMASKAQRKSRVLPMPAAQQHEREPQAIFPS